MGNLYTKQNTEDLLKIQVSAKLSYNKASRLNIYLWIISFFLGILWIISPKIEAYDTIRYVWLVIFNLICSYICQKIKYLNTLGASLKAYYDNLLFEFSQDKYFTKYTPYDLNEKVYDIIEKNEKKYLILSDKTGEDKERGVKNWYTLKVGLNHIDSIYSCQKENTFWDKNLSKIYASFLFIVFLFFLLCYLAFFKNTSLKFSLNLLLSFASLLSLIGRDTWNIFQYTVLSSKIETIENDNDLL